MKFLICGLGSIGQRHARNLKTILPHAQIIAYRSTSKILGDFEKKYNIVSFKSLEKALKQEPLAAFITNPTSLHVKTALACAKKGAHLFIEKPLSHNLNGISQLEKIVEEKKLVLMTGFMMHYNKGIKRIKELLDEREIGRTISVQLINGEYLPDWHPGEDYRNSYSAQKELGGGIILNFTHEIDLATWFFGDVKSVYCTTSRAKSLKTNVEDSAEIILKHKNNIKVYLHLDHISRPPRRTISVIGDKGRLEWDYYLNKLQWYNSTTKTWHTYHYTFDRNEMFISELKDFLAFLKTKKTPPTGFTAGKENLKITLAAKQSDRINQEVIL